MKSKSIGRSVLSLALSLVSGVMFAFAMPSRDVSWLAWIAFLPLLVAARLNSPLIAAGCGLLAGAGAAVALAGPGMSAPQIGNLVGAFVGLAAALALTACLASLTAKRLGPVLWPVLVACAGVSGEMLSAHVFPVNAALTQYHIAGALRLASVTGIWGVSFALWMLPASLISFSVDRRRGWPVAVASVVLAGAVVIVPFGAAPSGPEISVSAVQAPDRWNAAECSAKISGSDIIVWPEHVMDAGAPEPSAAARRCNAWVLASFEEKATGKRPFNTARLISPRGRTCAVFRKAHLFGQENLTRSPGKSGKPVDCGGFRAASAICFDTTFTDVTRGLVRQGAAIVLVPNSDPEMPRSLFHRVHRAFVAFRAAENGTPIVWAECTGLSCVFDGRGRIISSAPANAIAYTRATVRLRSATTLYTRAGDWFAYLCVLFAALSLVGVLIASLQGSVWRKEPPEAVAKDNA